MTQLLTREFYRVAKAERDMFPGLLKGIAVFLTSSRGAPVYATPDIAEKLKKADKAVIRKVLKEQKDHLYAREAMGTAAVNLDLDGLTVNMIMLDTEDNFLSVLLGKEMHRKFTLHHEIAHQLLRGGFATPQIAESACDAYALLRHIQIFGNDTGYGRLYGGVLAMSLILSGKTETYSTNALNAVNALSEEYICGLTPAETALLADRIAIEHYLDDASLEKIYAAYQPVRDLKNKSEEALARKTIAVMRKHRHDPQIFNAGKQFLRMNTFLGPIDPYWQRQLDFVNGRKTPLASATVRAP